jgi:protein-tyrosine phosphatase
MTALYGEMPFAPSHLDLFAQYFQVLAESDRPVLIHCAAGKDRTGMLAALTHHLLGVSRDDLLADYLLTNVAVDLEGRAPGMALQLQK